MWKLKNGAETVREHNNNDDESGGSAGSETWLRTLNSYLLRQVWEFHPELGNPEELQQIEDARRVFSDRRFEKRHSSDLLMRIQNIALLFRLKFSLQRRIYLFLLYHKSKYKIQKNSQRRR
ncbi:hypothetical protein SO802_007994 [Lithocarpus litseifolius]|uniref:Uncharacterized protein n=1 Tax=Lithocarpus litseifolius TaxID=425828 RepID=A0AAW2DVB4_9ROSI